MPFGRGIFRWLAAAFLGEAVFLASIASGQAQITIGDEEAAPPQGGFTLKKVDPKLTDAMGDFNRYMEKKAWEKAFAAIAPLSETEASGMIPGKEGFYFPARQAVMKTFLTMSAEGRDAYRLFNDAKAKQLFQQATTHPDTSDDDVPTLRKMLGVYFITSIGHQAADRLGDDLFEAGDFGGAEQAWSAIIDQQAESDLNIPRIQFKRGIAAARTKEFDRVKEIIRWLKEHGTEVKTTVAGKEVSPVEYLESLIAQPATTQASFVEQDFPPLTLPASDTPKWYFKFGDEALSEQIAQAVRNNGWASLMPELLAIVPGSAADSRHAYINWLGICYGLDAKTGKVLWRTDKPGDLTQHAQEVIQNSPDIRRNTVACAGDRVLFVRIPPKRMNYQEAYRLCCFNAQTGAPQWSSESGSLSNYSFACVPLVVDDTVYATASSSNGNELFLIAANLATGKSLWTLSLGQAAAGTNWRGMQRIAVCNLLQNAGNIYVLTNNGALLAVNAGERRLLWGFTYAGPPAFVGFFGGYPTQTPAIQTPAALLFRNNVLYFKEREVDEAYAIDVAGPNLLWKRPVEPEETIVGLDDSRLYTVGQEVGGIDLKTHALQWSSRLPPVLGPITPLMSGDSLFVFLSRGVYQLDTAGGDIRRVFRGYDKDSLGGAVYQSAIGLITVSDQALAAYPTPATVRK